MDRKLSTLDETTEEKNIEQHDAGHPEGQVAEEIATKLDADIAKEDVESILAQIPDSLTRRKGGAEPAEPAPAPTAPEINVDATQDIDLDTATRDQLLQIIANTNRSVAQTLNVLAETNIQQLETLNSVVDNVQPFSNITISGINATENADTAEPVVQNSDNQSFPTRVLMVKADEDNTADLVFGDDQVAPEDGFILQPGQHMILELDLGETALYFASEKQDQVVQILGVL